MTGTDEQALRGVMAKLESAWNRSDSLAWTALFAEDADLIHILGGHLSGHADIERAHRAIFDTIYQGSTLKLTVEKIRPVTSDVAIVFLSGELRITQAGVPPVLRTRPTLIVHRTDGTWHIVAFQNTVVMPEGAPAGNNSLMERVSAAHPLSRTRSSDDGRSKLS